MLLSTWSKLLHLPPQHRGLQSRESVRRISPSSVKLFMLGICSHNDFLKAGVLQSFPENISQGSKRAKEVVSMKHGKATVWKCPDGRIPEEELPRCLKRNMSDII